MTEVTLHKLAQATERQKTFGASAVRRLLNVVNDSVFIENVRRGKYSRSRFRTDSGTYIEATNAQIVEIIVGGKERKTSPDKEIDLEVKLAQLESNIVGRIKPPSPLITTNTIFVNRWIKSNDSLSLAAHWMHEWLHVAGFRHVKLSNGNPDRKDTVYQIGKLVVSIGRRQAREDGFQKEIISHLGGGYLKIYKEHLNTVDEEDGL